MASHSYPILVREAETMRQIMRWPDLPGRTVKGDSVAVVSVNHNTRQLVALLVYSLCRVLHWQSLHEVVVVDNGSTDGSGGLLGDLDAAGICTVLVNKQNRYHGPALKQALFVVDVCSGPIVDA